MSALNLLDSTKSFPAKVVALVPSFTLLAAGCGISDKDNFVGGFESFGV